MQVREGFLEEVREVGGGFGEAERRREALYAGEEYQEGQGQEGPQLLTEGGGCLRGRDGPEL